MNQLSNYIFYSTLFILLSNCANVGTPDGGPKDEDAPIMVSSNPPYETINFDKNQIRLYFDEYIKLKDLNKKLIVSPPLKNNLLVKPQNAATKTLNIKILDTLLKNTTYTINFGNAIEDNNEGNPIQSFKYVFSTGKYIDSLTCTGKVKYPFLNEKTKNINLLLYKINDSFSDSIIYKKKPNYVTSTLDSTVYNFSNLQKGKYLLIALKENFSDYIFNPTTDKIGFYPTIITLPRDSVLEKTISIFKEKQPFILKRPKEISKGKIIFPYQGDVDKLSVKILSKTHRNFKYISKFEPDKDTLNYWFSPFETDSLNFIAFHNNTKDTISVKLRKKSIDSLTFKLMSPNVLPIKDTVFVSSNNPIVKIDTNKIKLIDKDSLSVSYSTYLSQNENKLGIFFNKKGKQNYNLKVLPNAFEDIYNQKNKLSEFNFKTKEIEEYGRITIDVKNLTSNNLIIELVDRNKSNIIERRFIKHSKKIILDLLEPDTYYIRAIIDENNNNKWDTGNYLQKKLPETVVYYKEELKLRANYYLENNTFIINKN